MGNALKNAAVARKLNWAKDIMANSHTNRGTSRKVPTANDWNAALEIIQYAKANGIEADTPWTNARYRSRKAKGLVAGA